MPSYSQSAMNRATRGRPDAYAEDGCRFNAREWEATVAIGNLGVPSIADDSFDIRRLPSSGSQV